MKRSIWIAGAAAALLLTACSSGSQPAPSGSPSGPPTYTDADFGYSVTYEPPFAQGDSAGNSTLGTGNNPPASTVTFYDTELKVSRESPPAGIPKAQAEAAAKNIQPGVTFHPVALSVSVFPLTVPVTAETLPKAEAQLKVNVLPQLRPGTSPKLTSTTVAGRPGFTTTFTLPGQQSDTGQPIHTQLYWVFAEDNQYQVSMQAPESEWPKVAATFEKMLDTLKLPGQWQSASPSGSPSTSRSPEESRSPSTSPSR